MPRNVKKFWLTHSTVQILGLISAARAWASQIRTHIFASRLACKSNDRALFTCSPVSALRAHAQSPGWILQTSRISAERSAQASTSSFPYFLTIASAPSKVLAVPANSLPLRGQYTPMRERRFSYHQHQHPVFLEIVARATARCAAKSDHSPKTARIQQRLIVTTDNHIASPCRRCGGVVTIRALVALQGTAVTADDDVRLSDYRGVSVNAPQLLRAFRRAVQCRRTRTPAFCLVPLAFQTTMLAFGSPK